MLTMGAEGVITSAAGLEEGSWCQWLHTVIYSHS